jgi:predicted RND superfamily exporter protein
MGRPFEGHRGEVAEPLWLTRAFARIIAWRWYVVAVYALLLPVGAFYAVKVGQDNSIDRLLARNDPDYLATRAFEKTFGSGEFALLLAEADDPFDPAVVQRVDRLERALQGIPHLTTNSLLSVYRRAKAGFEATPEQVTHLRDFATGTDLFRRQGLFGQHYLAIGLVLDVRGSAERHETVAAIDRAIASVASDLGPVRRINRLGQSFVNVYLDDAQRTAPLYFVLFALFMIVFTIALYRSVRTLVAFLLTLATCLALCVGYIGLTGGTFTLVSPMVPMTVLVTASATLVYLQSRFVERPADRPVDAHQLFTLTNKFIPCTASIFATAAGFAALQISNLRIIREMGQWVAVGLAFAWVTVFTLFPALQKLLRTPTEQERRGAAAWLMHLAMGLPRFTYRWRWPLVVTPLALSTAGLVAVFGLPGVVAPMPLLTEPLEYINHASPIYQDMRRLTPVIPGLAVTHVWLKGGVGSMSEPAVLNGLYKFQQTLETLPDVGAVIGPTTIMRMLRYIGGEGDAWPSDPAALDQIAADLEAVVAREPLVSHFVDPTALAQSQLTVISRSNEDQAYERLRRGIYERWEAAQAANPALKEIQLQTAGLAPLQARMAQSLVPTLAESFILTVVIIFGTFLLIFRNGTARLMAMIPSLFAILVMFGVMRVSGMMLNIATILIASTVLGTSENDQIHFFYHFLEGRRSGSVEHALRHTLLVAGRAIGFATLINAGGFLAFVLADLPPMRQFGALSALAFVLSMIADFTALPAALWILFRERPDDVSEQAEARYDNRASRRSR